MDIWLYLGAAILYLGVYMFAHLVGGWFLNQAKVNTAAHPSLMNFAMLFTIFVLLAFKL